MSDWRDMVRHLPLVRHQPTTVVAATGDPRVLALLWRQPDLHVREARTADGVNDLLGEARLVILDAADLAPSRLDVGYLTQALAQAQIPHTDSAGFLADPARWLGQAAAFAGHIRSLPPRLVALTSLASGGVGKTTLTIGLALSVARRTRLPVALGELTHGASGFLTVLDDAGFSGPPADAYAIATQGAAPGRWRGLTVVPMDGRQGALLTGEGYAALLAQLRASHVLIVVDAVQPHALWPAVAAAADPIFVVAAADRPDTVANAQAVLGEQDEPRVRLVLNLASQLDRLASRLVQPTRPVIALPRRPAIARYADPLPMLTAAIWPGVRF
jgi:hypothetical protein